VTENLFDYLSFKWLIFDQSLKKASIVFFSYSKRNLKVTFLFSRKLVVKFLILPAEDSRNSSSWMYFILYFLVTIPAYRIQVKSSTMLTFEIKVKERK